MMALACCILFASCKKDGGGTNTGEDLSYLIKTYQRYESDGRIIKNTWNYDGYKVTGYQHYEDGLLYHENKNYSYNGLNASYDFYSYRNGDVNDVSVTHHECEYLDETFRRTKYEKSYLLNQSTSIVEIYYEYDGKKLLNTKWYTDGVLSSEQQYNYDGLRCTYTVDYPGYQRRQYEIIYLDETYLREKSKMLTIYRYDTDGNLSYSRTNLQVNEYDGKKPIGYRWYNNGQLGAAGRDYQYDGLNCYYFIDAYQDGEVVASYMYEVEYLE